uniref:Sugar transporter SWEET1 n=1 Tax=Phytophthora ramorum TaxID=164328 RepID=H3GD97_PHYRM
MASEALLTTLRVLTFVTAIAVGLSPFPEIRHVYKHRAVGDVSIFPIVALFGNSYLWMIYSYLIGNFFPLFSVTAFAAVTSIAFSAAYWWYSTEQHTTRRFYRLWGSTVVLLVIITAYAAIAVAGVTHQSKDQVVSVLGYMCVAMNLLLKFAPLETIKRIVSTKNASSMPVTMSVVAFVNGCLWVWTSAILEDYFVLTPNAAGAALGGIQVAVYVMYRPGKAIAEHDLPHDAPSTSDFGDGGTKRATFVDLRSPA